MEIPENFVYLLSSNWFIASRGPHSFYELEIEHHSYKDHVSYKLSWWDASPLIFKIDISIFLTDDIDNFVSSSGFPQFYDTTSGHNFNEREVKRFLWLFFISLVFLFGYKFSTLMRTLSKWWKSVSIIERWR